MTDDLEQLMRSMLAETRTPGGPSPAVILGGEPDPQRMAQWVRDNLYDLIAACIEVDVEQTGPLEVTITSELSDIEDGFGNYWPRCKRPDCDLEVVRPGKVQCSHEPGCQQ